MEPGGEARRGGERREEEEEEEGRRRGGSGSSSDSEPEPPACRSRRVSFADAFGLNLVSVKEFCTVATAPPPPDDDYHDDDDDDGDDDPAPAPEPEEYFLRSQFSVPASAAELLAKLETQPCELECVELLPGTTTVRGIVRVLNLCYHKAVCVRATLDGWASWFDLPADFVPGSSDGKTDRFAFSLGLAAPLPPDGARVEFCLRYRTPLGTFWANNSGVNYVLFCQQRGARDRKAGQCEDPSHRNKKSCLKINSKEKPTDPNTPVISAGNADGPLNEQEADVSKKTEEPAPNSDGLQDDSCQKSLVESGRNVSRRTRRRVARLAQIRDRYRYSRDSQSSEDTDSPVMWDWSQRGRKEQVESDGETLQPSAAVEPEALLLALTYAATANTTPDGPRENGQDLGEMSTDVETRGTTRAFESVEDGQASGCATAGGGGAFPTAFWDSGAPPGAVWDPTALQRTLWCPDVPQGAPWDSQGVLAESAAILSEVASGQESSPRGREEEPSRQTQAADDIIASERGYLRADIADVKDEDRQRSRTIGGDGARTDSHRAGLDRPRGERARGDFKFETFVAPLYHQASCRRRPESQDVGGGGGQWEGEQASDDEDDEGGEDGHDRSGAIANAPPLFPFGSYAPPVHPLQTSGTASSPRDDSPSADTHAPRPGPGQPGYGQEDTPPRRETGDPAAEVMAVEQVAEYGAEIILDRRVPRRAGIVRQDEELLFAANAVEGTQTLGDAETKTDATAMIGALAPSNADVSRLTLLSAHPENENKQYDLRGDRVTFTQAFGETGGDFTEGEGQVVREKPKNQGVSRRNEEERCKISEIPMGSEKDITDFMDGDTEGMQTEKEVSLDEGQIVSAEQEEEFYKTEVLSAGNQGLPGECLVKNEELDYEVSPEDAELLSVENEDPDDEVTVEGKDIDDDDVSVEDEDLDDEDVSVGDEDLDDEDVSVGDEDFDDEDVSVEDEDLDDDDVSVGDEDLDDEELTVEDEDLDDAMLVEEEDLDGDKVSVEGDDFNKNISLENNLHSGDNLNENKDFHHEDLSVKDAELVQDVSREHDDINYAEVSVEDQTEKYVSVGDEELDRDRSVENKGLYGDNLNENEGLENEELPIEDPELAEDVSPEHDHIDYDEVSVEEEAGKYISVGNEEPARDKSMENKDPYVENLTENYDRLSVENNDLENKLSLKDEDLDEEALSMENGDRIDEAGKEAPVGMDPEELTLETSTGKKDDLYDRGEVFFIERKDEHRDGGNETLKEREDLEEGVEAVFGGQDLKTDVLIRGDIHLHTDRTAAGAETERDVKDMEEVHREEGKSVEGGGPPGGENPDREAEEDSVSADSLTDDEMELHMRSVNSAHKQQLARGSPGNSRTPPLGGAKRPSSSRARPPLAKLSSISESLDEDEDADAAEEEESDLPPEETPGDHDAIEPLPVEKADDAAATYPSSCEESAILGRLGRAVLYALLCVLFFVTAYHHDFLACFALYLFSVFWLCFHGEKQRLQDANRAE